MESFNVCWTSMLFPLTWRCRAHRVKVTGCCCDEGLQLWGGYRTPVPVGSLSVALCAPNMCFSAINGSGPAYLSELLHVYTPSRTLRSSSDTRMLDIQQYKRKTHGFRTFSCFGPHIWNSLPQDLRHCSTLSAFKAKLKTFLFSRYFHPN